MTIEEVKRANKIMEEIDEHEYYLRICDALVAPLEDPDERLRINIYRLDSCGVRTTNLKLDEDNGMIARFIADYRKTHETQIELLKKELDDM